MLHRVDSLNYPSSQPVDPVATNLERDGHAIRRATLAPDEIAALRAEVLDVYTNVAPEMRASAITPEVGAMYRYRMFEHSALCQQAIARREILDVVEPLLGDDCHVIACTAWRNPPGAAITPHGLQWHIDGGPHVPRPADTDWPSHIAYPVFVISSHLYLEPVTVADGPTACIPGSHTSGRVPPYERRWDDDLSYRDRRAVLHEVEAGDVDFRVSDVWHRRMPPRAEARGRLFVQTTYARRDIAQRLLPCSECNHASPASLARARSDRERRLLGLHPQGYFDA